MWDLMMLILLNITNMKVGYNNMIEAASYSGCE
jgi:hypothetical protein